VKADERQCLKKENTVIADPTCDEIRLIITEAAEGQDTPDITSPCQLDAWREAHAARQAS
jgi:hypothetical protein